MTNISDSEETMMRNNIIKELAKQQNTPTFLSIHKPKLSTNEQDLVKIGENKTANYYSNRFERPNISLSETIHIMSSNNDKPFLVLTCGPTGTGKSNFKRREIDNKLPEMNFKEISIDEDIENDETYKREIYNIIIQNNIWNESDNILINRENITSPEVISLMNKSYKRAKERQRAKRDRMIKSAISNQSNVIIETTGKEIPIKYVNKFDNYNIVFCYILIPVIDIKDRCYTRAVTKMQTFMSDPDNRAAPRLPDTVICNIVVEGNNIIKHLMDLRNICLKKIPLYHSEEELQDINYNNIEEYHESTESEKLCGNIKDKPNFGLIIYNNSTVYGDGHIVVYNHFNNNILSSEYFEFMIKRILYPDNRTTKIYSNYTLDQPIYKSLTNYYGNAKPIKSINTYTNVINEDTTGNYSTRDDYMDYAMWNKDEDKMKLDMQDKLIPSTNSPMNSSYFQKKPVSSYGSFTNTRPYDDIVDRELSERLENTNINSGGKKKKKTRHNKLHKQKMSRKRRV